jgi:hypothetical protein
VAGIFGAVQLRGGMRAERNQEAGGEKKESHGA